MVFQSKPTRYKISHAHTCFVSPNGTRTEKGVHGNARQRAHNPEWPLTWPKSNPSFLLAWSWHGQPIPSLLEALPDHSLQLNTLSLLCVRSLTSICQVRPRHTEPCRAVGIVPDCTVPILTVSACQPDTATFLMHALISWSQVRAKIEPPKSLVFEASVGWM